MDSLHVVQVLVYCKLKKKITSASGIDPLVKDCHFKYFWVIGKSGTCLSGLQWGVCSENMRGGMVFFPQSIDSFFVRSIIIPLLSHHIMYEFLGLSNDVCNPVENQSSHRDHRISKSALNWTGCLFFIDSIKNAD